MGIIIHSLESVSFKDLYAAFSSAFKDYDFSLNADELRRMLDRRGYNPQLSFGAFFEGRLISFVFNGTGMYNNILTAYDTGTGTVPSFRGLHLTQKIFTFSLECLEDSRPFRAVHPHVRDNFYFLYYILYRTSIFDCCFRQKEV